jgi:hypothetical protein
MSELVPLFFIVMKCHMLSSFQHYVHDTYLGSDWMRFTTGVLGLNWCQTLTSGYFLTYFHTWYLTDLCRPDMTRLKLQQIFPPSCSSLFAIIVLLNCKQSIGIGIVALQAEYMYDYNYIIVNNCLIYTFSRRCLGINTFL